MTTSRDRTCLLHGWRVVLRWARPGRARFFAPALGVLMLALAGTFVTSAAADTVDFSDLGPDCTPGIPDPYHGVSWSSNLQPLCNELYAAYGNSYGAPSGWAVTNGSAEGSGISALTLGTGTFGFGGALFSSFALGNEFDYETPLSALSLQLLGYRPGDDLDVPTYASMIDLDPTTYVLHAFDWTGLHMLVLGAGNGPVGDLTTGYGIDGLSWLMTDVQVQVGAVSVPDPGPGTLFTLGVWILLGTVLRRRQAGQAG